MNMSGITLHVGTIFSRAGSSPSVLTDRLNFNGHKEKLPRLTDWYIYQSTSRNDFISVIQLSQRGTSAV